jgi:uncharacterized membrane protein affecting hemolysin expression
MTFSVPAPPTYRIFFAWCPAFGVNELTLLANTLGANAAATMVFNDPKTAAAILNANALRADRDVLSARLYDNSGHVFAEYVRAGASHSQTARSHP